MKPLSKPFSLVVLLLACLPALAVPALNPPAQSPPPQPTPAQQDRELLDQAFRSLEEELKAAIQDYNVAIQAASKQGIPRDQWPKSPAGDYYARFEELALKDQPDSLRWCIGIVSSIGFSMDEAIARKIVLYEHMVRAHATSRWIGDIVQFLSTEGAPTGIGIDRAVGFLDDIAKVAPVDVRAKALWTKGQLYAQSKKPEHAPLVLKTQRVLAESCPGTLEGRRAKGLVFQADHLAVGMTAPDVTTVDPDGAPFKLSDYRGKVVAVVFWGFWCQPCMAMLPHEKALVARLADKPFALIGVNTDESKDDFKKKAKDQGVTWKISWQGSRQGPWPEAWGVTSYPGVFVLDEKGVIRAVNVRGEELSKVIDDLLAKMDASKNDSPKTDPKSGDKPQPK